MIAKRLLVGLVAFGSVVLGLVAIELAPAVIAQQQPPYLMPHGASDQETALCAVCHDWHVTPDPDINPEGPLVFPWEQLLNEPSEVEVCYSCHDGSGADSNIERDFGVDTRKSFHPVLAPADDVVLACSDCHAQHQDPADNAALLYREMAPGTFLFGSNADPIGDTFCYGCHGSASSLPAPFGDHGAFEASIHATDGDIQPPTPDTDLKCSACHEPHASDYTYLTKGNEEELCYSCHSGADPNTAGGSNPQDDFTAVANDYSTTDGDGVQIFHHPVANGEQDGGARVVECASCHNSHLADRIYTVSDPARARTMDSGERFNWSSGYNRSNYAAEFCGTCHADPTTTAPLPADPMLVPYDVTLVNDSGDDPDGEPHDTFDLSWFTSGADSAHGNPAYVATDYEGCPPGGDCQLACTACHDFHGSTNAYMLREDITSPDYRPLVVTSATWTPGQGGQPGVAELTVGPHGIAEDWIVTVAGMDPSGYDGAWTVVAVTGSTVSFELATDPGAFVSGGTLDPGGIEGRPYAATIVNFGGLDTASDRNKLQTFCLTCHLEQSSGHQGGKLCTQCHSHDPNASQEF